MKNLDLLNRLSPSFSVHILAIPKKELFNTDNVDIELWNDKAIDFVKELDSYSIDLLKFLPTFSNSTSRLSIPKDVTKLSSAFININNPKLDEINYDTNESNEEILLNINNNYIFIDALSFYHENTANWFRRDEASDFLPVDRKNHLVLICLHPPYFYLLSTSSSFGNLLSDYFSSGSQFPFSFSLGLRKAESSLLENAFANGEAYQLWLYGLHRSVVNKPDKKTFSGLDLREALDPLGDQSFSYNAILSKITPTEKSKIALQAFLERRDKKNYAIGFSKSKKTVWMSKCRDIADYIERIQLLSIIIKSVDPEYNVDPDFLEDLQKLRRGINHLSKPIPSSELRDVADPFEISLNIEYTEEFHSNLEIIEHKEDWARNGELKINSEGPSTIDDKKWNIDVFYISKYIAKFSIKAYSENSESLSIQIEELLPLERVALDDQLYDGFNSFDHLVSFLGTENAFTLRFESGHVLQGKNLFKPSYNDVFYDQTLWTFLDLKNWEVDEEKPSKFNDGSSSKSKVVKINNSKSLFSKVILNIPELIQPEEDTEWHCMCHDGANEIADFIYCEPENRRIDLIHVKGAHSNSSNREISITAYETVCEQAVKNLRHLNIDVLVDERFSDVFKGEKNRSEAGLIMVSSSSPKEVKHDCTAFIDALEKIKKSEKPVRDKRVVVFQPHIRKSLWRKLEEEYKSTIGDLSNNLRKSFMLSTILYETQIACTKQQATFEVWGEDDTIKRN